MDGKTAQSPASKGPLPGGHNLRPARLTPPVRGREPMRHLRNRICSLDRGSGFAMFLWQTGTQDFTYSPLDTSATASGGVIF
jgi:hypothetical protein